MLKAILIAAVAGFLVATGSYISSRILLPGMGLTVPHFSAYLWATFFMCVVYIAVAIINTLTGND